MKNTVTLRSVYGKVKTYYFTPLKGKNGLYPTFVKKVRMNLNNESEMILSESELNSENRDSFIPEDMIIEIIDGHEFDLDNDFQKNQWEAIKNSQIIAPERGARDEKGNLIIDGDKRRYGLAELWVEKPGEDSEKRITRTKLLNQAYTFIEQDNCEGRLTKVKLLGKIMRNAPESDIQDFLYQKAEKNPQMIIDLYSAPDTSLRLLLIDAQDKRIINKSKGVFIYGDISLGVTEDSVILFLKSPANKQIYISIRNETYPDMLQFISDSKKSDIPINLDNPIKLENSSKINEAIKSKNK